MDLSKHNQAPESNQVGPPSSEDRTMALIAHLLGILTTVLGVLIIYLINKDKEPNSFVLDQAKESLNFQITVFITGFILGITLVGIPLISVLGIANLVFCIMAAVKANEGIAYRYPLCLRLIK